MRKRNKQSRETELVGARLPLPLLLAMDEWVAANPERTRSIFIRDAVREKLQRARKGKKDQHHAIST